jgi:hypothetical protein
MDFSLIDNFLFLFTESKSNSLNKKQVLTTYFLIFTSKPSSALRDRFKQLEKKMLF